MIGAGPRNVRVAFEREAATEDAYGRSPEPVWTSLGAQRWAAVSYGAASERREAAQTTALQVATLNVLADSLTRELTEADRALFHGATWGVVGAVLSPNRAHVVVTVSKGMR